MSRKAQSCGDWVSTKIVCTVSAERELVQLFHVQEICLIRYNQSS